MCFYRRGMFAGLALLLPAALLGCGEARDPLGRRALTGMVTFRGEPLEEGFIKFLPKEEGGLSAGSMIRAGHYGIPREQGLVPGLYRVEISALTANATPAGPPGSEPVEPAKERLPAEYNVNSRLSVEVKADQEARFDFPMK